MLLFRLDFITTEGIWECFHKIFVPPQGGGMVEKMKKRILTLALALLMCLSLVPMTALAADDTVDYNGHRYQRIEKGMTWTEAKTHSEGLGGHLVTITSAEEQAVVQNLIANGSQNQYWLGAEYSGSWITEESWDYHNWALSEPNGYEGVEHYVQMYRLPNPMVYEADALGKWNDINNENHIDGEEDFFSTSKVGLVVEFDNIASNWAQTELEKAAELGLIPDSLKGADLTKPITRAEFAAVSVKVYENLSGTAAIPAVNNPFTDTKDVEVLKAYNVGITAGTAADKFSPDALLNREQSATMLARVFKKVSVAGWTLATDGSFPLSFTQPAPFADDAKISDWAKPSVYFMAANGIISGTGGNNFAPKATTSDEQARGYAQATREQALVIAVRMVEKLGA
jgi:hypothetical protein